MLVFAALAAGLLFGAHVYMVERLIVEPGLGAPWRSLATGIVVLLASCLVAGPIAERTLPLSIARVFAAPAALWMGTSFLLVVILGASDLLLFLFAGAAATAELGDPGETSLATQRAVVVLAMAAVASAAALRSGLGPPRLVRIELELPRWPRALDGFRIAQISDIHIGPLIGRRFAERLTRRVNELDADLVALTGDLVDGRVPGLAPAVAPFSGLEGRHGVYFVTGNHDHYSGADDWAAKVAELGLTVLRNRRVEIRDGIASFDLIGVDDHRGDMLGSGGEDLPAAVAGRDAARPAVLLAHDPSTFKRAARLGIDLQISGHTHGGQIWPFHYLVRLAIPWLAGHYRLGDSQLYVSRGSGFWGPPMRLFAPAEITELVLRARRPEPKPDVVAA